MGLETALVIGGLSIASGIGQYNQAKSKARATARQGERAIENRKNEILALASKQKMAYLDSGVELEGTPQAVIQDTYNTGLADIADIKSATRKSIKNQLTSARANLLGSIANAGVSAVGMYNMFSGASGLGSANGIVSSGGGVSTGFVDGKIVGRTSWSA